MSTPATALAQQTEIGDVGQIARRLCGRTLLPLTIVCSGAFAVQALAGNPASAAFALIAISSILVLGVWSRSGKGLPLIPLFAFQHLIIYGLPIVVGNQDIFGYPVAMITDAGWEVFALNIVIILTWRVAMEIITPSSQMCYALQGFDENSPRLQRIGIALLAFGTVYDVLERGQLLNSVLQFLPTGSTSIIHVLVSAASACGFFLTGMLVGRGRARPRERFIFWTLLLVECVVTSAGFLLSACITVLFAALIGLFWGSGRVPWRLVTVSLVLLAFFNLGKFTMRAKYWHPNEDEPQPQFTLAEVPRYYSEWTAASFDALLGKSAEERNLDAYAGLGDTARESMPAEQNLFSRINNLQNLLFVIDATESKHIKPLGGATYSLIPPLLVPRVLWPDKPRTHEGQVLLNVYFGRQDLNSTLQTYIAWGLLPEAYGNFGPITGAIMLGAVLGGFCAWVEQYGRRKLLLSMEGFLSFTLFLGLANSYETVASVLVTMLFQAFVPIILASAPFVDRVLPTRPTQPVGTVS